MSDATRSAVPKRKLRSLFGWIASSFPDAMTNTCCVASSARSAESPSRRSERQMKSKCSSNIARNRRAAPMSDASRPGPREADADASAKTIDA